MPTHLEKKKDPFENQTRSIGTQTDSERRRMSVLDWLPFAFTTSSRISLTQSIFHRGDSATSSVHIQVDLFSSGPCARQTI